MTRAPWTAVLILTGAAAFSSAQPEAPVAPRGALMSAQELAERENEAPTDAEHVELRFKELKEFLGRSGRSLPRSQAAAIQRLIDKKELARAARMVGALYRSLGRSEPRAKTKDAGGRPPAPLESDKAAASALYYQAMQRYADGQTQSAWQLLRSAAKLDPSNTDVAQALERIGKELPGSGGERPPSP